MIQGGDFTKGDGGLRCHIFFCIPLSDIFNQVLVESPSTEKNFRMRTSN